MSYQQGWQQQAQAAYYYPPPPPPRKKRTGLIITLAVGIPVLLGLAFLGYRFYEYSQPVGNPASGRSTGADCKPADDTLRRAGATNLAYSEETNSDGLRGSLCMWHTLEGSNGKNFRYLSIQTSTRTKADGGGNSPVEAAKLDYRNARGNFRGERIKEAPGIGDEAAYLLNDRSDNTNIILAVRKGTTVLKIEYMGYTQGFFGNDAMPLAEGEATTKMIAEELLGTLA